MTDNGSEVYTGRSHQGRGKEGWAGGPWTSISEPDRIQQFQFQISEILLFTDVQKLYGPKISRFYRVCYNIWTIYGDFSFFLTIQWKYITPRWTFRKGPILNTGPSEKFLILDRREFKRQIIPGTTEKVLQNKRTIHIRGPQLTIIASILELLKIFSEVIAATKCGPLARIEKQAITKLDLLKSFSKIKEAPV